MNKIRSSFRSVIQFLLGGIRILREDRVGMVSAVVLTFFIFLAVAGPSIAPYPPSETIYLENGMQARLLPPSLKHPFGTTNMGQDVFSQTIVGARIAVFIGLISALFIVLIGTNVGLIAGYFGKSVDDILMRITDVAYGIPFIPFAIVLVTLMGVGTLNIILAITTLMWRTTARVIRSQVLSLRERPFVWAAKVAGAGHFRLLYIHIAPNVLPLSLLYMAFGVAWGIMAEASLGFLGLGDPEKISWGQMLYFAFRSGAIRTAWWWVVPPGLSIILVVASCYLVGRTFEVVTNPKLQRR
ncbi:MAG TPA: ABC transporter permease [Syntrophus sp. (in: bacteria)]|nr:ABC transporter permease [Syntrophus sp. (in: bacteria)]